MFESWHGSFFVGLYPDNNVFCIYRTVLGLHRDLLRDLLLLDSICIEYIIAI